MMHSENLWFFEKKWLATMIYRAWPHYHFSDYHKTINLYLDGAIISRTERRGCAQWIQGGIDRYVTDHYTEVWKIITLQISRTAIWNTQCFSRVFMFPKSYNNNSLIKYFLYKYLSFRKSKSMPTVWRGLFPNRYLHFYTHVYLIFYCSVGKIQ